MIKRFLFLSAIVALFASCGEDTNTNTTPNDTASVTISKNAEATEILMSDFDAKAANLVGKEVKVSGIVDHVCKHGGKKILLVDGDNSIHVFNDNRYDEALSGSKISVIGVVEEERVDSVYLAERLKHEEGSNGDEDNDADKEHLAKMKEYIKTMQDSLKKEGVDHFSNYSLKYVSHTEEKTEKSSEEK